MSNLNEIKDQVHTCCGNVVKQTIERIKTCLHEAQEAANNETKSSAGDKHETGRAMAQLETEKLTNQLTEALKLEEVLSRINSKENHTIVGLGSLVSTDHGDFYISASLGKIVIDNYSCYAISTVSPIGKLLLTKKEKDNFSFNGKSYVINRII